MTVALIALLLLVVVLAVAVVGLILYLKDLRTRLDQTADELKKATDDLKEADSQLKRRTEKAVASSRTGHVGLISEQLAPLLPGFPYDVKDVHWIGGTIDMIVWNGLEKGLEDGGEVEVVLLDVKTGKAQLTKEQRRIRDAVRDKRVRFDVYRFRPEDAELPPAGGNLQLAAGEPGIERIALRNRARVVPLPGPGEPSPELDDVDMDAEILIDADGSITDQE